MVHMSRTSWSRYSFGHLRRRIIALVPAAFVVLSASETFPGQQNAQGQKDLLAGKYRERGMYLLSLRKFDQAIQELEAALRANRSSAELHNLLGMAYAGKNDLARAGDEFQAAVNLDANLAEARSNLGLTLLKTGKPDPAVKELRRAIQLSPGVAANHYRLGLALSTQSDWPGAVESFRRTLELDAKDPEAFNNLGVALMALGSHDEALSCFQRALQLRPNYAEGHYNLGTALLKQQRKAASNRSASKGDSDQSKIHGGACSARKGAFRGRAGRDRD